MNAPLFQVVFRDGTVFAGGTIEDTKWDDISTRVKIRSLFYLLPTGDYLSIGGYDKYYQFIEATQDVQGGNGQINREYAYVIGVRETIAVVYKINLKTASIETKLLKQDDEFITKLNPIYWR